MIFLIMVALHGYFILAKIVSSTFKYYQKQAACKAMLLFIIFFKNEFHRINPWLTEWLVNKKMHSGQYLPHN